MTVIFRDLHRGDHLNTTRHRQDNCVFDEIVYADEEDMQLLQESVDAVTGVTAAFKQIAIELRRVHASDTELT